ncbi:slipin family protein [Streptomyces sp. 2A115]|uniref:slipin family protein n=1 Tax=Streptomyces sp. 2A115 TaxID=3457439 RepID=UPI003FD6AE18
MVEELVTAGVALASVGAVYVMSAARVVKQYERGVVLRLGKLRSQVRGPGFTMIVPFVDRLQKVNMQIVTMPVPAQDGITRDNVTVRVDAVIYFKVVDAADAVVRVEDYRFAVSQMAQTSLRSIIGKSDLDDLLSNREKLNQGLELMIDSPAVGWGVQIDRVEIKDVSLPETMKRSMARQAEADRERRARVINADAELQASKKLAEAAGVMSEQPAALQLRLLQTVVAVAAEKNSTLVLPFPVELLRFLERAQQPAPSTQQPSAAQGQQSLPESEQPSVPSDQSASQSPSALAQGLPAPAQQLLSQLQQSMQEQLPPVETSLDPDFGGSKSGQD